jgi:DnaK suppressor protein
MTITVDKGTVGGAVDLAGTRANLERLCRELDAEYDEAAAVVAEIASMADRDGDDEVDAGAKTAQRDHQLTLLASIRERRTQAEHALERIAQGTYGRCESCGEAISPARLEVFPAATSCVDCKRAGERRL